MEKQYITLLDFVLLPFVLALVYLVAYRFRNKKYSITHPWRKYFIPALTVKVLGALFISLIYVYYYKGGDTTEYYLQGKIINSALSESFIKWINLIFNIPTRINPEYYEYTSQLVWYKDSGSYFTCAASAFLSIFVFETFLPTAVLFAAISFTGIWALFRTFANLYPKFLSPIAIATLFIPSVAVWGSGVFKDTACVLGLGWLTYTIFRILIKKDFSIRNIFIVTVSFIMIATIKIYILLAFLVPLALWILSIYTEKIASRAKRFLIKLAAMLLCLIGFSLIFQSLGADVLGRYSLEKIESTAELTRQWIHYSSGDEGSSYTLGDVDPSITGMLFKFPLAVNVTLFRPYLWESRKIITLLSAIEALVFLLLTVKLFFSVGVKKIFQLINTEPSIQFCLIFSLIFAFAVGVTSYNFGSLSRYKIPCLPFYLLFIILTYYKANKSEKRLMPKLGL